MLYFSSLDVWEFERIQTAKVTFKIIYRVARSLCCNKWLLLPILRTQHFVGHQRTGSAYTEDIKLSRLAELAPVCYERVYDGRCSGAVVVMTGGNVLGGLSLVVHSRRRQLFGCRTRCLWPPAREAMCYIMPQWNFLLLKCCRWTARRSASRSTCCKQMACLVWKTWDGRTMLTALETVDVPQRNSRKIGQVWDKVYADFGRYRIPLSPVYRYNRLSNPLSNRLPNRFDNRLYRVYKHSTGCQARLTTGLTNGCIVYTAGCQSVIQHGLTTGLTNSGCSFNNMVVKLDVCLHDTAGCQTGCTTSLTTGCMV